MSTIEEAKAFITDAIKAKENWQKVADRSWNEIKKRQQNNKLWAMGNFAGRRQRARYPAWFSIFQIRKPLLLSRVGIPIGKDTSQDGNDNVGATAAILRERLAVNLARAFPFFDVMADCRDDFLATNFAQCRGYYEREEVKEPVKEYITPQKSEDGQSVVFIDAEGKIIESDNIMQDDEGYFLEHEEVVDVENEKICLEPILYREIYVDPDIRRWQRCRRLAFAEYYAPEEFKQIFGTAAYIDLSTAEVSRHGDADNHLKRQKIKVYEYWDEFDKEVQWFAENGTKFIKPRAYLIPADEDGDDYDDDYNGLYNLEGFFPCPPPLIVNAPTDEFWPVPEYYQVVEILEDIHTIFGRMMALTRAIRARLLFDNNVDGLQAALNEATEGDAFGVPNLAQSLAAAGGSLENVVQYIPVEAMVNSLAQTYQALEQRLSSLFKLTGTSDLLQGLTSSNTDKTLGERQMEEKYAINQIAEMQRKMAEFVRDSYQLITEMALKNFKDASLDMYIIPATLPEIHKRNYRAALGMLKDDSKRFRIELETDSTIAINEAYDKQIRLELVNICSNAFEKAAEVARTSPALLIPTLHSLKYLIQGLRQAKLFQDEFTQAIDQVIEQAKATPAPFNKEQSDFELAHKKLSLEEQKAVSKVNVDMAKMQMEGFKANSEAAAKRESLDLDAALANIQAQRLNLDAQIAQLYLQLDQQKAGVEIQNKLADNQRLETEVVLNAQQRAQPSTAAPQVVVVPAPAAAPIIVAPQAAPVAGPTIINAPNPTPQTSVIQPVQEVPVPVPTLPRPIL